MIFKIPEIPHLNFLIQVELNKIIVTQILKP